MRRPARCLVLLGCALLLASEAQAQERMPDEARVMQATAAGDPPARQSASPPNAAQAELERRTSALASELRCPVCQGLSIEDSPTDLAREMRAVVKEQLAAGRSEDEVREYFVAKYGEWILLRPEPTGVNLLVYVLPWLGVLVGAAVIVLLVRRWTSAPPTAQDRFDPERFDEDREEAAAGAWPDGRT